VQHSTTVAHCQCLNCHCGHNETDKERVLKKALEWVELVEGKLSDVKLVEYLKHHKRVEKDRVV
jgi:hypothetical protein